MVSDRTHSILFFVKLPRPGAVKTRLGRTIGYERATQLYDCFVQDLRGTLAQLGVVPLIFYAPAAQSAAVAQWLGPDQPYYPQIGEDLGARMAYAFRQGFELGYTRLLIVGSDSPDLPLDILQTALRALEQDQIVIGPSQDGGYYALGFTATNFVPQVFAGIPWSTSAVYAQTLQILARENHSILPLRDWYDVDTVEDLWQFYQRNQGQQPRSLTMQYLDRHQHDLFQRWTA